MANNKVQKEIEDLLARLDTFPPPKPWHVRVRESIGDAFGSVGDAVRRIPFPRVNLGYVVLGAIVVAVMAYFLDLGSIGSLIIIGAVLVFIAAFVMSLRQKSRPSTKYWRDRPMDMSKPGPDWRRRRRR